MSNKKYNKKPISKVYNNTLLKCILLLADFPVVYDKYNQKKWRNQDIARVKKVASIVYGDKVLAKYKLEDYTLLSLAMMNDKVRLIVEILKSDRVKQEAMLNEIILGRI